MAKGYLIDEKEFRKRVENSRNNFSLEKANCLGNAYYLAGLISKEIYLPTQSKEIIDLMEECPEKEAIFIAFERKDSTKKGIYHIITIDSKDREVAYFRMGIWDGFMEGKRRFMVSLVLNSFDKNNLTMKYYRFNPNNLEKLLNKSKTIKNKI